MATATALPFTRSGGGGGGTAAAAAAAATLPTFEETVATLSTVRVGLFFIGAICIGIIIIAIANLKMGTGTKKKEEEAEQGTKEGKKESPEYPNKIRDIVILALSIVSSFMAVGSIIKSYHIKMT